MQISTKFTIAVHIITCIDYFKDTLPVTSSFLAGSVGVNPVIIRGVMSKLKEAGIIVGRDVELCTLKRSMPTELYTFE